MKKIFKFILRSTVLFLLFILFITVSVSCNKECTHDYFNETIIEPTCDKEGKTVNSCAECDFGFYTDYIAPTGHTFTASVFTPTCEHEGYTYYACDCGYSYKSDFIFPLGHTGEETVIPATCKSEGYTLVSCVRCNENYKKDQIPPITHKLESSIVPATCTEAGYTQYDCSECDFSYKGDLIEPQGHTFTDKKIGASMTHSGYTLRTCDCGYSYKGDYYHYNQIFSTSYCESSVPLMKGLDISKNNHMTGIDSNDLKPLDWVALRDAGFEFVILKIGSTNSGKEVTFEEDYAAAKAAGFKVGVYFYTYATTIEQTQIDADNVIKWLNGKQLEFPVFYDIEDVSLEGLGQELLTDMCVAFIERMQENFFYAALYSNNPWLNGLLDNTRLLDKIDIWYARWWYTAEHDPIQANDTQFKWKKEYGKQLSMWQYASTGVIDGFKQSVSPNAKDTYFDFNYCYKDFETIIKTNHLNGY